MEIKFLNDILKNLSDTIIFLNYNFKIVNSIFSKTIEPIAMIFFQGSA